MSPAAIAIGSHDGGSHPSVSFGALSGAGTVVTGAGGLTDDGMAAVGELVAAVNVNVNDDSPETGWPSLLVTR